MGRAARASVANYAPDLVQERLRVERIEAEPAGDLFARRLRAFAEQIAEHLAVAATPPPVGTDLPNEVVAELRRADPRPQVVGRVEAGVHVREVVVALVTDARRLGQQPLVDVAVAAVDRNRDQKSSSYRSFAS